MAASSSSSRYQPFRRKTPKVPGLAGIGSSVVVTLAQVGHPGEHRSRALPRQVADHAIVGQDAKLLGGKQHGEEPVVLAVAAVLGWRVPQLAARAPGAGRAVVPVRDVGVRHRAERVEERAGLGHPPDRVAHAVRAR